MQKHHMHPGNFNGVPFLWCNSGSSTLCIIRVQGYHQMIALQRTGPTLNESDKELVNKVPLSSWIILERTQTELTLYGIYRNEFDLGLHGFPTRL